jgi:hypothetical protein
MCEGGSSTPPEQTEGPSKPNYYKVLGVSFGVRPRLRRDRDTLRVLQRNARLLADTDAPVRINTPWCCTQQADFNQLRSAYLRLALVRPPGLSPLRPVFLGALTRLTSLRRRLQRFHPDKHPGDQEATARFQQISEAFRGARAARRRCDSTFCGALCRPYGLTAQPALCRSAGRPGAAEAV